MGKVRPQRKSKATKSRDRDILKLKESSSPSQTLQTEADPSQLLLRASELLQTGEPNLALPCAQRAISLLSSSSHAAQSALPALTLLGEIQIELGDAESALKTLQAAATLDPKGLVPEDHGGGAEKFLWLAQLCEDGGRESLKWFERGIEVLQRERDKLETKRGQGEDMEECGRKISAALCGMIEVWMTDLS